jgi:hypothetical protein
LSEREGGVPGLKRGDYFSKGFLEEFEDVTPILGVVF